MGYENYWLSNEYLAFVFFWILPILGPTISPLIFSIVKKVEHKVKFILTVMLVFAITSFLIAVVCLPFIFFNLKLAPHLHNNGIYIPLLYFDIYFFISEWGALLFLLPLNILLPWFVHCKYPYFQARLPPNKN